MKNFSIDNDPTDTVEEVKEYSAEEKYYQWESELPDAVTEYVTSLERQNKAYRVGIKKVVSELPEHLTHYRNQLNDILKV